MKRMTRARTQRGLRGGSRGRKKQNNEVNEWKPQCGDKLLQTEDDASMAKEGLKVGPNPGSRLRRNEGEEVPGDEGARLARAAKE